MIQFGMPALIENRTLGENAALCRRLGLRFIEMNMNLPEYQAEDLERTDALLEAGDKAGIYFTVHLDENLNIADFNPLVAEAYRETVRRTVAAAKKLLPLRDRYGDPGQPLVINMHMHHGVYFTLPEGKVRLFARDPGRYLAACRDFRDRCEDWIGDAPVMLAVENTDGFLPFERDAVDLFLESPCFGLTWDIGHSKATGERDMPFILARQDRLIHFHIHDGSDNPPRDHLALGDGEIDIGARLDLARAHRCRCVLETKTAAALEKSVIRLWGGAYGPENGGGEQNNIKG